MGREVQDLVEAGHVSIEAVEIEFAKQRREREEKWLAKGKSLDKLKPTVAEKQPILERKIIIEFRPQKLPYLMTPIIFSLPQEDSLPYPGFAVVTDNPQEEIMAAGHDRMPIYLSKEGARQWLAGAGQDMDEIQKILDLRNPEFFIHDLAEA